MGLAPNHSFREINANSTEEIQLVASRMQQTLIEVLGEDKGKAMYSMNWLVDRVLWHLDATNTKAKVYVVENESKIIAHAIARIDKTAEAFGYFSTLYVEPSFRRIGIAQKLVDHVELWFRSEKMPFIVYNTATTHLALITLFEKKGFSISLSKQEMVQLKKFLF